MNQECNRKECPPETTISRIEGILKENKINVKLNSICSQKGHIYSSRVTIEGLPGLGTNGKGITKEYSIASAYGELMERVQSGYLTKHFFSTKHDKKYYSQDESLLDANTIINKNEKILGLNEKTKQQLYRMLNENEKQRVCAPFYNCIENKVEHLPIRIIEHICGSNGLCAGNSIEEALVQGICEILERFIHKRIFFSNPCLPTIPLCELGDCYSFSMIQLLIDYGFTVLVKDCTLGGEYPVIAVLLIDKSKMRYRFSIGSDPDIDIALQRCITEMFQGIMLNDDFVQKVMKPISNSFIPDIDSNFMNEDSGFTNNNRYNEWKKAFLCNSGEHPLSIFSDYHDEKKVYKNAFIAKPFSNRTALEFLLRLLSYKGKKVYIRDYSILGFPTYRIYIPEYSECTNLFGEDIFFQEKCDEISKCFNKIRNGDTTYINTFVRDIDNIRKSPYYNSYGVIQSIYKIFVTDTSKILGVNDNLILALTLINKGDYKKSLIYFKKFLDETNLNNLINNSILIYLSCKAQEINSSEISKILKGILGEELSNKFLLSVSDEKNKFDNILLPNCPDCNCCKLKGVCLYENWREIDNTLSHAEKKGNLHSCSPDFNPLISGSGIYI